MFISECFSGAAANAFVEAGVPHVIAVQESVQVMDNSALAYAKQFYLALCQGLTVAQAFSKGLAGVIASSSETSCCCTHLHAPRCFICSVCKAGACCSKHAKPCHETTGVCCGPRLPHGESSKFVLLPAHADHNVQLFRDVPAGDWVDCNSSVPEDTPRYLFDPCPTAGDGTCDSRKLGCTDSDWATAMAATASATPA